MRVFSIISRDGELTRIEAKSDLSALLAAAAMMGLQNPETEGSYRLRLPGGTVLHAVEVR